MKSQWLTIGLTVVLLQKTVLVKGQSYSGCHSHGSVEWCYGPDGEETPITTAPVVTSTTAATAGNPAPVPATTTSSSNAAAVTGCHKHGSDVYCIAANGEEVQIQGEGTPTGEPPAQYTGCHNHGDDQYCIGPEGEEVLVVPEGATSNEGNNAEEEETPAHAGEHCHFHAGVEHCVGGNSAEHAASAASCRRRDRDYNIPFRIGSIFVILVTSAIAVYGPILYSRFFHAKMNGVVFTMIKQFGTGVMISTALVHLFTHASLMFTNECLGELAYEATTASIVMAGLFLSFLIEYIGNRILLARSSLLPTHQHGTSYTTSHYADKSQDPRVMEASAGPNLVSLGHHHHNLSRPDDKLSIMIMEAGVIFHSIIIGLTLVVAGDSGYATLFVVIIFHQMFEGLALGARIAALSSSKTLTTKLLMAFAYAVITPIGMAIGLGVIHSFNGNDRSTILAIGTLDALSAGILLWVALVDMWSHDWLFGDLAEAGAGKVGAGFVALMGGMVLMGVLGKWA